MNIFVNPTQLRNLMTEISTKLKSDYKGGVDHKVFFSKKYPDKLFKVGPKRSIDRWFDIFNSNSQIFPKVYYRKQLKGNEWKNFATFFDDLQDTQYDYVLIERLNTDDFEKFWLELDNALVYILDEDDIDQDVDLELISFEYKTNPEYKKIWIELLEFLKKNKPHLYDRAVELHEIIKTLHKVKEFPDIHMFQFGIDSSGKIKALDI